VPSLATPDAFPSRLLLAACAGPAAHAILLAGASVAFCPVQAKEPNERWMMAKAHVKGIEIEYETMGDPEDRPLLLIIGLADQLIHWDDSLCADLVGRGHYVIRFDNRDSGLSAKCDGPVPPSLRGQKAPSVYSLDDMADDAMGLLDALGIARAHLCGASMGGMIAQCAAIRYSPRCLSLTSIYSTTGNRSLPPPNGAVMDLLLTPAPKDREGYVEYMVLFIRMTTGKGFPFDEAYARQISQRAYDRSFSQEGTVRQLRAIATQTDRRGALAALTVPTLVVQGTDDPLVSVEAGRDMADAIPGARLMLIEGMGHDLACGGAWFAIAEAVANHTRGV
jgi:pimeloyl-ACP methyl ester carboxylesterase